jgi:hypothetical protein
MASSPAGTIARMSRRERLLHLLLVAAMERMMAATTKNTDTNNTAFDTEAAAA